tara:strand:+ start:910 stop:1416 length:507 start_codon:yes stop_codon:yes gene_type:complete
MSGRLLSFKQYIGGADDVQVIEKFPSEQKTFTYSYGQDISNYTFELDAQTIVVDTVTYNVNTGDPVFSTSNVIGFFANVDVGASNVSNRNNSAGTVNITMPSNLYAGNVMMPDARTNVPITVFSVKWTDTGTTPSTTEAHRWAVIERYSPGDKSIGNILADTSFVSIT